MTANTKHANQPQAAPTNTDNEINTLIYLVAILALLYLSVGVLGIVAPWIYLPITYIPMLLGQKFGVFGISSGLFLLSLIFVIVDHFWSAQRYKNATVNPERSYGLLIGAGFLMLYAIITAFMKWNVNNHPLFAHIYEACNPSDLNSVYTSCQMTFKSIFFSDRIKLLKSFIGVNIIFLVPIISEIIQSLIRIANHPSYQITKKLSPEDLVDILSNEYPHLKFFKKFNPNKYGLKTGPFSVLLQSREFAVKHGLIKSFSQRRSRSEILRMISLKSNPQSNEDAEIISSLDDYVPNIDEEKFELLCLEQLGRVWEGLDKLTPAEILVLSIAAPQCCATEEIMLEQEADDLLKRVGIKIDQIWVWLADNTNEITLSNGEKTIIPPSLGKWDQFDEYKKDLRIWLAHPIMLEIISKHAYINTIIYETMLKAKTVGVLQPSSFRWLKLYKEHRPLYALIQNVGRPSVFAENMASVSHYYEEKKAGTRIYKPSFQNAYSGFCDRLNMFKYTSAHKKALEDGTLSFEVSYREKTWEKTYEEMSRTHEALGGFK